MREKAATQGNLNDDGYIARSSVDNVKNNE
ncbi:protein of unknown function [Serratia sp. Tan611]|nr:protein of unknown function [Serratia sp. Tan611]